MSEPIQILPARSGWGHAVHAAPSRPGVPVPHLYLNPEQPVIDVGVTTVTALPPGDFEGTLDGIRLAEDTEAGVELAARALIEVGVWGDRAPEFEAIVRKILYTGVALGAAGTRQALVLARDAEQEPAAKQQITDLLAPLLRTAIVSPMFRLIFS